MVNATEINSARHTYLHIEDNLVDKYLLAPPNMPNAEQTKKYTEDDSYSSSKENHIIRSSQSQLNLIYGDNNLADENAIIFFITGDGFDQNEQNKFWDEATKKAYELVNESPFDEFKDDIKIYGYNVISKDSGPRGDGANSYQEALNDNKDTYFGSTFWYGGTERLLAISPENTKKLQDISNSQLSKSDQDILIVNTETYGGSGGTVAIGSLNDPWGKEIMLHEMGHSFAGLVDNYYAGDEFLEEAPNLTKETDPNKVKWKNRLGQNGIGIYEMVDGWYKPSTNCKMEFLGNPFSDVAKDAIRDSCKNILSQKNDDETSTSSSSSVDDKTNRAPLPSTGEKQSTYLAFIGVSILVCISVTKLKKEN